MLDITVTDPTDVDKAEVEDAGTENDVPLRVAVCCDRPKNEATPYNTPAVASTRKRITYQHNHGVGCINRTKPSMTDEREALACVWRASMNAVAEWYPLCLTCNTRSVQVQIRSQWCMYICCSMHAA
jgi:hypothetical protein